jgi:hypothetical protein
MLWMSWLVVGLYDVRFVTDSIFGMPLLSILKQILST